MSQKKIDLARQAKPVSPQTETEFLDLNVEESYNKANDFFTKNSKILTIIGTGLLAIALLYMVFTRWYLPGQEKKAQEAMFKAESYFAKDEFDKALNGDGNDLGFLGVIDNHSSFTNSVNLAHYYAGASYLNLGNFNEALNQLKKFKSSDAMLSGMAKGMMGDCYMELGEKEKATSQYKSAANGSNNEFTGPYWMMKAGQAMEDTGDPSGAKAMYERIKEKYPTSTQGMDIERYLERVSASK